MLPTEAPRTILVQIPNLPRLTDVSAGQRLVSGRADRTVRLWDLDIEHGQNRALAAIGVLEQPS